MSTEYEKGLLLTTDIIAEYPDVTKDRILKPIISICILLLNLRCDPIKDSVAPITKPMYQIRSTHHGTPTEAAREVSSGKNKPKNPAKKAAINR